MQNSQASAVCKVAVTGATGFIGRALVDALHERGFSVAALSRDQTARGFPAAVEVRRFDPNEAASNPAAFADADIVIHLAGEPSGVRCTADEKRRIHASRVAGTQAIVTSLADMSKKPHTLVCASSTGFYGARGDEVLTESSHGGNGFQARVAQESERAAAGALRLGIRTVMLRMGTVLGDGGALWPLATRSRWGLGVPSGYKRRFFPWIHLDDAVELAIFCALNSDVRGPVNAVAPDYATGARLGFALGGFALRAGSKERWEALMPGQLVLPAVAEDAGYRWRHPNLEAAILAVLAGGTPRATAVRRFETSQFVPAPIERVFAFFSEAENLESITPSNLRFTIGSSPPRMQRGATICYRLRIGGIPVNWTTLISLWDPPRRFIDVQLHGPYALWRHEHTFTPADGGVLMRDVVDYLLPLAPFSNVAASWVDAEVRAIFRFRRAAIAARYPLPASRAGTSS